MTWATILGWGRTALGFASGIKLWLIGGAVVVLIVGGLYLRNGQLAAERDLARRDAADTRATLEAWQEDAKFAYNLVTARDAKIAILEGKTRELVEELRRQPVTRACAASPAVRLLLERLRDDGADKAR